MIDFKYECLLIIDKNKEETLYEYCNDEKRFLELFNNNNIKNKSKKLIFEEIEYQYELKTNVINEYERYFHLHIKCSNEENIEKYTKFLKELRRIFSKHKFKLEILRDDLPLFYSEKAYVLINKIENHMRKLIKYFLITKVGNSWIKKVPKEINDAINNNGTRDKDDILKRLDFIQLGYFLFKKYSDKNINELQNDINENKISSIENLDDYKQTTNWEKYFKNELTCNNDYIESRWKKLYDFRCDIAHNKDFTKDNMDEVKKLCKEINDFLSEAFENVNKIKEKEVDKTKIENMFQTIENESNNINSISSSISELTKSGLLNDYNNINSMSSRIAELTKSGLLNDYNNINSMSSRIAELKKLI